MSNNQFSKKSRLCNKQAFKAVFDDAKKIGDLSFTILFKKNNIGKPRLGVIVAKKNTKKAVARNRVKRLIRESYRQQQHLQAMDIIVLSRRHTDKKTNSNLHAALNKLWQKLQCPKDSLN